jgi:hypothetical protein
MTDSDEYPWDECHDWQYECADCGRYSAGDACQCCGAPLCGMCAECSAGFCDECLHDPQFSERMVAIYDEMAAP